MAISSIILLLSVTTGIHSEMTGPNTPPLKVKDRVNARAQFSRRAGKRYVDLNETVKHKKNRGGFNPLWLNVSKAT